MLRALDSRERRVLIAHERSHLRRGHHRYIRLTELAVAAVPVLAPLKARVRFAVERWADEDAAVEVGDRRSVARAIGAGRLGVGFETATTRFGHCRRGTVERAELLLAGPGSRRAPLIEAMFACVVVAGVLGLIASALFVEPWVMALLGLCH